MRAAQSYGGLPTQTTEEPNFSKVTAEVNRTGRPVTVLKNNKPWVIIQPASTATDDALDVAVDFMDEYTDVFSELAK
ncbi:type II toxin-antitoxin system Phd/YefM family antitoxin [Atopobium sp. oral taxon 416]|uniref:type II toxin-antitoxin system Phd/YefM family antitoxin n=1 Tax=Atopobium sp. oral taxon 416 TaxID=712157 RepID=UPI001BA4C058|nr:type II toxin-antitoxin system Phd/YefM family antitoxin [Atopobium sp. oral taxon 416]QUC02980.1 type II toxin-antitoxin system Phd/YefM family antitoxin [Atopobium sp. oral taxon 416]